jgi:6-pyruvoyltetrahydropterin/6-carboxytetrahydropterin synthase
MPDIYVSRTEEFSASHRLYSEKLTPEENLRIYGNCANPNGHGHNYTIEVTLKGAPDPITGMVFNLSDLKKLIREHIIEKVDHKNLNTDVDFLSGVVPTAENLAAIFFKIMKTAIPDNLLYEVYEVRVLETPRNWASCKGDTK